MCILQIGSAAADAPVLKHRAASIHSTDSLHILSNQFKKR